MLKKQKLRLLSFHELNTGDIQTQATKILRLANESLKVKDGYASTRVEQNTMFARIPSQVSFVNAPQLLHRLPSPVKKTTPRQESQRVFGSIMFLFFSNTDIASCIQCPNFISNNNNNS